MYRIRGEVPVSSERSFEVYPTSDDRTVVPRELSLSLEDELAIGERAVVLGWPLETQGRKRWAGTAIYGEDARRVARAKALWFEVPASAWT